jgi:hypothetical protein
MKIKVLERDAIESIAEERLAGYLHWNTLAQSPVGCIIFPSHRVLADGSIVAKFRALLNCFARVGMPRATEGRLAALP